MKLSVPGAGEKHGDSREATAKFEKELMEHRKEQTQIADRILDKLAASQDVEILSLDPDTNLMEGTNSGSTRYTANDKFAGGFKIIGVKSIRITAEITQLVDALRTGLLESKGESAECFAPRHGIRFTVSGKTYLAIICFQCLQAYLCEVKNPKDAADLLLSSSPEKTFDAIFAKHGLKKAP